MKQLVNFFENKEVVKVLDVGTGSGYFMKVLKRVFPSASLTGVDPDTDSLEEAAKVYPDVNFQKMSGEKLDFKDNSFDVASISMALHHLSDIQLTLLEMQRVVRSGGWIIVNELFSENLNPAEEVHKRMHHFRSRIDRLNGICHNEAFTRKEIVEQIEKAGLRIELKFEFKNPAQAPTAVEIEEQRLKLQNAVKRIEGRPEYDEMIREMSEIEAALGKHGFEMSPRLVSVARVTK